MNTQQFTQKSLEAIQTAQSMARENRNPTIMPEHMLYALIDQDGGLIPSLLSKMGADSNAILSELDTVISGLPKLGNESEIYISRETERALNEAQKQAKAAFGGNVEDMPTFEANGLTNVIDIIAAAGITKSKGEARRLIEGNAISVDDTKITMASVELSAEVKEKGSFVLHKGKKVHLNVIL